MAENKTKNWILANYFRSWKKFGKKMQRVFPLFVDNRLIFGGMFVSPQITTVSISRELDPKLLFRNRYIQNGTVLAKYAHCFAILMRLRQLCLHPKLCEEECQSLQRAQDLLQGIYN